MTAASQARDAFLIRALVAAGDRDYASANAYLSTSGLPLPEQGEAARLWCEEQAEQGNAEAQFVLAKLATVGLFGPEDKRTGLIWCEKAVEQGHPPAMMLLAGYYEDGWGGLDADPAKSLALIQAAAARNYPPAYSMLGSLYANGRGVPKSDEQAIANYRKGAKLGDAVAQFLLGTRLLESGATATEAEGLDWVVRAAEQDHASAHSVLASLYMGGRHGLDKDPARAKFHYERAAEFEGFKG
jgi:TPR repeat protein